MADGDPANGVRHILGDAVKAFADSASAPGAPLLGVPEPLGDADRSTQMIEGLGVVATRQRHTQRALHLGVARIGGHGLAQHPQRIIHRARAGERIGQRPSVHDHLV